jgi:predicted ATPase
MQEHCLFSFGPYRLDVRNEQLWRGSELVRLTHKALTVLGYLAERKGELVTKGELFAVLWPGVVVSESALVVCVRELRRALGDTRCAPHFIETVHGRGYRFLAPVHRLEAASSSPPALAPPTCVGREAELAHLHRLFDKALRGERQMVFVTGEAGIGKTTLINQFLAQIHADRRLWSARGQCVEQHGTGEAYLPLLDALGRLCRGDDGARMTTLLHQHAPIWLMQMPALLSNHDLKTLQRRGVGAAPGRMLRELTEALDVLTRDRALVLVLEDLLWSDAATVAWLGAVARRPEPAKLLLIGTYRPVEVSVQGHPLRRLQQALQVHGLCEELPLRYLTEDAIAAYLAHRFHVETPDQTLWQELARLVRQRTAGNPFFMVHVVKDWVRQEVLGDVVGQWQRHGCLDEIALGVPDNLRQLIEQQLEQLDAEAQALLETASVVGLRFTAATVAAALEVSVDVVEAHYDVLVRREQFVRARCPEVWPDGTTVAHFEFRHALYQEVLYHRISATRRMRLHQRIGERLAPGYTQPTQHTAAVMAEHFRRRHGVGEPAMQRAAS